MVYILYLFKFFSTYILLYKNCMEDVLQSQIYS